MNNLQNFEFETDSIIRVSYDETGTAWFVANDVCVVLGIANNRDALSRIDEDEKGVAITDTLGGKQSMTTVNESGLYSLIFSSRKPEAIAFRRWVTREVLPALRQTGRYEIESQARLLGHQQHVRELLERCTFRHLLSAGFHVQKGSYLEFAELIEPGTLYDIRLLRKTFLSLTGLSEKTHDLTSFKYSLIGVMEKRGLVPDRQKYSNTIQWSKSDVIGTAD